MKTPEVVWHGWLMNGVQIHVGPVSNRKAVALTVWEGTQGSVVAYFRDKDSAEQFMTQLDRMLGLGSEES